MGGYLGEGAGAAEYIGDICGVADPTVFGAFWGRGDIKCDVICCELYKLAGDVMLVKGEGISSKLAGDCE